MSTIARSTGFWTTVLSSRSLDARIRLVPRVAVASVAMVLLVAIAGGVRAGNRLESIEHDAYPALLDARELAVTLAAVRGELATGGDALHEARLDSLADRFHAIARRGPDASFAAVDTRFSEYLSRSRRSSLGLSTDDDGASDPRTAAEQSYAMLESELGTAVRRAEGSLASSLSGARTLQSLAMLALMVAGALALAMVTTLAFATRSDVFAWIDGLAGTVDDLCAGRLGIAIRDSAEDAPGRLGAALRRMARQLRDNFETADALAEGAFRRAVRTTTPSDPIGIALDRLSATMSEMATASQRVTRGDLDVIVTPQSPDDAFGAAYAAMMQRVVSTLHEVESTRASMLALIESMRGDAAALASSANIDADRLRRTEDRLTGITIQARADVTRGVLLTERTAESEALLDAGSAALQSSIDGLSGVLRSADAVQHLAREAGLLAIRGAVTSAATDADAVQHAGAARALATEAAAAAGTITRIMIGGTEHAYDAGVALDRVAIAVRDGAALVRELGVTSERHAAQLIEIDDTVSQVSRTTSNSAETARQIVHRLDSLASHARRLQILGRRRLQARVPSIVGVATGLTGSRRSRFALGPVTSS